MNDFNPGASYINDRALVVLSGGLDSAVLAYALRFQGFNLTTVWFDYGQRHVRERQSAEKIAKHLQAEFWPVDMASIGRCLGENALTGGAPVPHGHYEAQSMAKTVVPMRNALFLSAACGIALGQQVPTVALGIHAGDHAIYPDCRPEFLEAFQAMVDTFTEGRKLNILAPFIHKTKAHIVTIGYHLAVPFAETWSCYEGGEVHCGRCGTCVERKQAFGCAGVKDPTEYAA